MTLRVLGSPAPDAIVLRDLRLPDRAPGAFLVASLDEWRSAPDPVEAWRGPGGDSEWIPAELLAAVHLPSLEEDEGGFWTPGLPAPGFFPGPAPVPASLGAAKVYRGKVLKKGKGRSRPDKKKRKREFRKKEVSRKMSVPEATQLMWAMVFPQAFQPEPAAPPEKREFEASSDAPDWVRKMDLNPRRFFPDLDDLYKYLKKEILSDPGWKEMVEDCRAGLDLAAHYLVLVADGGSDQEVEAANFFGIPMMRLEKAAEEDPQESPMETVIQPFADEVAWQITRLQPDDFEGEFSFYFNDANQYGLLYSEC